MNGIRMMKPLKDVGNITKVDILSALLVRAGVRVSSMPPNLEEFTYTSNWEFFNPEKVKDPDDLPDYWGMVFDMHNRPDMKDCRDLKYRYVHTPERILPQFPRVLCRGIFCLTNKNVKFKEITADDLIYIGNEFESEDKE